MYYSDRIWVVGRTIFTQFSILLRDLRRATRLETKVSVFDLGPRSTVQSQLHDFWIHVISLDGFLSESVAKCGRGGGGARGGGAEQQPPPPAGRHSNRKRQVSVS